MNSEGHKLNNNERRSGSIWHTVIPEHRFFNSLATSTSQLDRKLHNSIRRHSPTIQTSLINTLDSNVHNPQSPDSLPQTLGNGDLIRPPLHNGLAEKNPYRRSRNPKSSTTCRSFCLSVCRNYYVRRPIFLVLLSLTFLGSHMVIFYKYFAPYLAGAHPIPTSESRNGLASAISRDKFIPESIFSTPSGNDNTEEWAKGEEFPDDLLRSAQFRPFAPLRPIDKEKFTVRINTWRRNELLVASVNHHTSCEGVAQVQIVWNDPESGPPGELLSHKSGLVVIEDHTQVNSLNERFNVKTENPPTVGILNVDDDVFYPCEALDAGAVLLALFIVFCPLSVPFFALIT
uniref:Glycosyl transferase 64 domain-containing protein n=1 Tax=Corethron hystrix TaxID=216773 RepID=A0A7S1B8E9_9STRA|mmetsp:Transcript_16966/g.38176  ORF Transcript_16966/g.38176 Transcript_16966/m.38176 type:complete len:344 (+) Transcript_16966:163-1194(+)